LIRSGHSGLWEYDWNFYRACCQELIESEADRLDEETKRMAIAVRFANRMKNSQWQKWIYEKPQGSTGFQNKKPAMSINQLKSALASFRK